MRRTQTEHNRSAYPPIADIRADIADAGDGCLFGLVPLGGGRTYSFAYVAHPRFRDPLEGRLARLRQRFSTFGPRVAAYLAALEGDDEVICSAMEWMELVNICAGRVVLVGDAAHASSPM